ncbi:MAG TPA: hypothetical protein PL155_01595 [Candidatus Omnitrophota bacterium]|nr:hypothetical protein [Candidatus Omnitrophota bacterium]HPD84819.1 hypothetical protein [Candidatus Omnitrophota bacterium]HRZ03677.1 hypothetical protein [Candidatus Omnitrophota bacterium]
MPRLKIGVLIVLFFFPAMIVCAQNINVQNIPEGMEVIEINGSGQIIVPKGAKTRKIGAQIFVEGTKEYMSRRFEEIDERLANIEKTLENLQKEIESLKTPQARNR